MPPANYRITRITAPAATLVLVTLDQAKAVLGIDPSDTSKDPALTAQIDAVSLAIDNYCDRTFARQSYRDQYRYVCNWLGLGEPLVTRQWPIAPDIDGVPVVAVTEDGAALDVSLWEVEVESGSVYRLDSTATVMVSSWTGSLILVDYDAGYDEIPADVQNAALEWLGARWYALGRDPTLRTEAIPDVITHTYYSDTTAPAMPSGVREWLAPYKRWFV